MSAWEIIFATLSILGLGGGATAWFMLRPQMAKLRAETKKAVVDAATTEDRSEDEHLKTIVEYVVEPLKNEVVGLRREVAELKDQLQSWSKRYRLALDWIQQVVAWKRAFHPDIDPPMPTLPPEVQEDL